MLLVVVSVLIVLWWSSFGRWGLAFSLPWILAYFYFIWIYPAHQLSVGIRRVCIIFIMSWMVHASILSL